MELFIEFDSFKFFFVYSVEFTIMSRKKIFIESDSDDSESGNDMEEVGFYSYVISGCSNSCWHFPHTYLLLV